MQNNAPQSWASGMIDAISHAYLAHSFYGNSPEDAVRFHDHITPYLVHPLWCAASLLQEAALPLELRKVGYIVLLWHDILEDTGLGLPNNAPPEITRLVEEMSFGSFSEERELLWTRSYEIKLFKLYDKVSNLLDGAWMKAEKWNQYVEHTIRLANEVESTYGNLNIVKIARAIALMK